MADHVESCTIILIKSMMHCLSIPTSMQLRTLCIVCQFWCETLTSRSLGTLPSTVLVYTGMCCTWSAYQSQRSIQSHDTWSMWLTGKFKISVWVEHESEAWEVRTEREVSWGISWNTAESKSRVQKGRKSYFAIVCTIAMWHHGWIYMTN